MGFGSGGFRPGSGRKCHLEDQTAKRIVRLSSATILKALTGRMKVSDEVKIDLAKHFVLKAMPTKIEGDGVEVRIINIVGTDESEVKEIPKEISIHRSAVPGDDFWVGNGQESLPNSPSVETLREVHAQLSSDM